MRKKELRYQTGIIEARTSDSGEMILEGRAVTYGVRSVNLGGFREIVLRGSIKFADTVKATVDHDDSKYIGRTGVNLVLEDREDGVYYVITLPDSTLGRDLYEYAKKGLAVANSFEFYAHDDEYEGQDDDLDLRTLKDITLVTINPLMMLEPAYKESVLEPRSYQVFKEERAALGGPENKDNQELPKNQNSEMKTKKELLEERAALLVVGLGLTDVKELRSNVEEVTAIDEKLQLIETRAAQAIKTFQIENPKSDTEAEERAARLKEAGKLNLRGVDAINGNVNMNSPEVRAVVSTNVTAGKGRVMTSLIEVLAPETILMSMGATISYNNYDTVLPISKGLSGTFEFKGENITAPKAGYTLDQKTLTPKRVPITIEMSKTAVMSDEVGIEADILKLAIAELYLVIEKKMFGNEVATATAPAGLLALATAKSIAAAGVSQKLIIENKNALRKQGVNKIGVIGTSEISTDLELTPVDAGSGIMLMDNDRLRGGLPFTFSAYLKDGDLEDCALFGDFSKLYINFFGGVDFTKDIYTKAGDNLIVYTFQFNVDWALVHPAALLLLRNIKIAAV